MYILTGASGSGKTELLINLLKEKDLNIEKAPKYASREKRNSNDDINHADDIEVGKYDVVYNLNKERYGIIFSEIDKLIEEGKNVFIILSYIRVVKELKERFQNKVTVIYISSAIDVERLKKIQFDRYKASFKPDEEQTRRLELQFKRLKSATNIAKWDSLFECMNELNEDWKTVLPMFESTEVRASKIRDFHKTYLDNIHVFDHVILNYKIDTGDIKGFDMVRQARNIIACYNKPEESKKSKSKPVIFVLAAASGTGKGILMETLNICIGKDKIHVVTKQAKREAKKNDKRDGLVAIGRNGIFSSEFDIKWTFHNDDIFQGTEYAISSEEVKRNTDSATPQIVVSNMRQFGMFREKYQNRIVFLYLHALRSKEDVEAYQYANNPTKEEAESRISEIENMYAQYIERISEFDHVLLNTAYPEDLYEQIFTLIEFYNLNHK